MRLADLKDGEIEIMGELDGACDLDVDGLMGIVQKGHHAPWGIRRYAVYECLVDSEFDCPWPRKTYMRDMPWSLKYPDEPPCDRGPESVIWEPCKRTDAGAIPVTVIRFD